MYRVPLISSYLPASGIRYSPRELPQETSEVLDRDYNRDGNKLRIARGNWFIKLRRGNGRDDS